MEKPINARRHGRRCGCASCIRALLNEYQARLKLMSGIRPPDMGHTIPVRPHWRKVKNHLGYNPVLQEMVRDIVKGILKGRKE